MEDRTCLHQECDRNATRSGSGRCPGHYWEDLRSGVLAPSRVQPPAVCGVDDCGRPGWCKDWCKKHYTRWIKCGEPVPPPRPEAQDRFWAKVVKQPSDGCWLWTGGATPGNYGVFFATKALTGETYAHRISYALLAGPIPEGYHIDHLCHSQSDSCALINDCPHRRCVRPDHLEAVTAEENSHRAHGGTDTHCKYGHPYDGTTQAGGRWRLCSTCMAAAQERARAKSLEANPPKGRKRTHCRRGHEFTPENTLKNGVGRTCRACSTARLAATLKGGRVYELKTHCIRGHEMVGDNVRMNPNGSRACRACVRARRAEARAQAA